MIIWYAVVLYRVTYILCFVDSTTTHTILKGNIFFLFGYAKSQY